MKWTIPAKTFLIGEYVAIAGGPAIVLTTTPCFELSLSSSPGLQGIHPDSPAGLWWQDHGSVELGLEWFDPYHGLGGLGASSAQFLAIYQTTLFLENKTSTKQDLLEAYWQYAWNGQGLRPSAYDVLAQSSQGCVYIHEQMHQQQSFSWPFQSMGFILIHTQKKLATHQHLQSKQLMPNIEDLSKVVELTVEAFEQADASKLITSINTYHQLLLSKNLVAEHSLECMLSLQNHQDILAMKGCGAMGADVILILVPLEKIPMLIQQWTQQGWIILATSVDLFCSLNDALNGI